MSKYKWSKKNYGIAGYEKDLESLRAKKEKEIEHLRCQIEGINLALDLLMRRVKEKNNVGLL